MRRRRAALPKPRQGDKRSHESNGTRSSRAEARPGRGDDLDAKRRRSKGAHLPLDSANWPQRICVADAGITSTSILTAEALHVAREHTWQLIPGRRQESALAFSRRISLRFDQVGEMQL